MPKTHPPATISQEEIDFSCFLFGRKLLAHSFDTLILKISLFHQFPAYKSRWKHVNVGCSAHKIYVTNLIGSPTFCFMHQLERPLRPSTSIDTQNVKNTDMQPNDFPKRPIYPTDDLSAMWGTNRHQGRIINTMHSALLDVTGAPLPHRDGNVESMEAQLEQHGQRITKIQGVPVDQSQYKYHKLRSDVDTNAKSLSEMKEGFACLTAKKVSQNEALCSVQNQLKDHNRVIQEFTIDLDG